MAANAFSHAAPQPSSAFHHDKKTRKALDDAIGHHQAGRLQRAEQLYNAILKSSPTHPDALHLLGLVQLSNGNTSQAKSLIQRALKTMPSAEFYNSLGNALMGNNETQGAIDAYEQALTLNPGFKDALFNLGNLYRQQKTYDKAIAAYEGYLTLHPNCWETLNNLANIFYNTNQLQQACTYYERTLAIHTVKGTERATVLFNYANVLGRMSRVPDTITALEQAIEADETFKRAYLMLAMSYCLMEQPNRSYQLLERALKQFPEDADVYQQYGTVLSMMHLFDEAERAFLKAITLNPDSYDAASSLGFIYASQGKTEDALKLYQLAFLIRPSHGLLLRMTTVLPVVYKSREDIERWRNGLAQSLLAISKEEVQFENVLTAVQATNFYLAYQAQNDRPFMEAIGQLYRLSTPVREYIEPPRNAKPRIGFISKFLVKRHTIGKLNKGIINGINRDKFDVVLLPVGSSQNVVDEDQIGPDKGTTVVPILTSDLQAACDAIAAQNLDILFFTDIGMEPSTYFIAQSRLARVQCVTWGHPVTTGLPTMDYFVTSKLIEPDDCQDHYTEYPILLDNLSVVYDKPYAPDEITPRDALFAKLNITNADAKIYLCPQTVFKIHPDFDPIIQGILSQDPNGQMIFVSHYCKHANDLLMNRLLDTVGEDLLGPIIPDAEGGDGINRARLSFVSRMARKDFVSLMAQASAMLDPLYFGGGNTSLEAFSMGTPIVTWPGPFMRGRVTHGLYQKMGLLDLVANSIEDYVAKCVALGTNPDFYQTMHDQILANCEGLFNDTSVVAELEQFFEEALAVYFERQAEQSLLSAHEIATSG